MEKCKESRSVLAYETVALDEEKRAIVIVDQTKLPFETRMLTLTTQEDIWNAIYCLQVRGAPAIGITAAFGIYLGAKEIKEVDFDLFYDQFKKAKEYLDSARPTAVNLSWALNRMEQIVLRNRRKKIPEIVKRLHEECVAIKEEDIWTCKSIGEYGLSLVKPGDGILTHCNAGQLATAKYGTATAPIYLGQERGYQFKVFADETRPLLQGARLTAYELQEAGVDVTLICDNMSGTVMKNGWIQAIFVGCDRVAANGDTANKIGTSVVATVAKHYGIPFYVCAPTATIDRTLVNGDQIPIEERSSEEVTTMWYEKPMAPAGVKVYNPSFDVTEAQLITAIITEYGIATPPFENSLRIIFDRKATNNL